MGAKSRSNFAHYPNPGQCCERCVFGSGEHSAWCQRAAFAADDTSATAISRRLRSTSPSVQIADDPLKPSTKIHVSSSVR